MPKGLLFRFENGRDVIWFLVLQQFTQHVRENINRLRDLTFRSLERRGAIGHWSVEGAKNV